MNSVLRNQPAVHALTCGVWFGGLDVHVSRFSQHLPHVFLEEREEAADVFPREPHQRGQIRSEDERQQRLEVPVCNYHVHVESFHVPGRRGENE